jgi:hypothetical protein
MQCTGLQRGVSEIAMRVCRAIVPGIGLGKVGGWEP